MNRLSSTSTRQIGRLALRQCQRPAGPGGQRCLHQSKTAPASVAPITGSGPPPPAPAPSAEYSDGRLARKRRQASLLQKGRDLRAGEGNSAMRRRFWQDVNVKKIEEGPAAGQYQILLDTRPVRTPEKKVLTVPGTKPHLAEAIALEWDLLVSAQQALKTHLIPLTSLVARALDIAEDDSAGGQKKIRDSIMTSMMRYLSTDTLLCWAETPPAEQPGYETHASRTKSLRQIQKEVAQPIIEHLSTNLWPGVEIVPVLEDGSIMPIPQPQHTQDIIRGWMHGLPAFELAGLERAVLAGKSLMIAARLVAEWSEEMMDVQTPEGQKRFGVEEAAHAATLEVEYQLGMWGVVEDTHDVDREDVKRQFGSVVLLVSGETRP